MFILLRPRLEDLILYNYSPFSPCCYLYARWNRQKKQKSFISDPDLYHLLVTVNYKLCSNKNFKMIVIIIVMPLPVTNLFEADVDWLIKGIPRLHELAIKPLRYRGQEAVKATAHAPQYQQIT